MATNVFHLQRAVAIAVRKLIECPVCHQVLRVPFKQCVQGHNTCSECALSVESCSICGGLFYTESPAGATRLLNSLPKLCQYSVNGCPLLFEGEEDRSHAMNCEYRSTICCNENCNSIIPMREMVAHFEEQHKEDYINQDFKKLKGGFDVNVNCDSCKLIVSKLSFYWLLFTINREENQLEVRVFAICNTWPYEITVNVKIGVKEPYMYMYAFRPCFVDGLGDVKKMKEADRFCMKVPLEVIKEIADDDGNVKCIVIGPCGCKGCDEASGVTPQKKLKK